MLPLGLFRNAFEMPGVKHVAILIKTSRVYGRGLLRGIARQKSQTWSVVDVLSATRTRRPRPGLVAQLKIACWWFARLISGLSSGYPRPPSQQVSQIL